MEIGRMHPLGFALLFWVLAGACHMPMPPDAPNSLDHFHERIEGYEDNGFRVVVATDRHQPDLQMEVRYTVGSGSDPAGKAGLAHVVEHLMFEIPMSDEAGAERYRRALSRVASYWNAYTSQDATSYQTVVPAENLSKAFELEMLRAKRGCRGLAEEDFLRAREIVRNEARESAMGESGKLLRTLEKSLYIEGHPYRSSVLGTDESISSISVEDVCQFIQEHYHPGNTIIVISGDIRTDDVKNITKRWFPSFPTRAPVPLAFPAVSFQVEANERIDLDVGTSYLFAMWPLEPRETDEHDLQRQIRYELSAKLRSLVTKADWGSNVETFIMGGAKAPALVAAIELRNVDDAPMAKELVAEARKQVLKLDGRFGYSDYEYRRQTQLYEDVNTRTRMLADYEQHRDSSYRRDRIGRMVPTSRNTLHEASTRLLAKKVERFLLIVPKKTTAIPKTASFQYESTSSTHDNRTEQAPELVEHANHPLSLPESLGEEQTFRRYRLPNGLELVLWVRNELPLVYGRLVVPVGAAHVPTKWAGLSHVMNGYDTPDVTVFRQTALAKQSHALISSLADKLNDTERVYSSKQLESLRRVLSRQASRAGAAFLQQLQSAIYGSSHPYANTGLHLEALDSLTAKAARTWGRQARSVNGATLIVTGRFDPELMYKQVLYYFRDSQSHVLEEKLTPTELPAHKEVVTMVDENMASLGIYLTYRGSRGIDSTQPARDILADIINARLQTLREESAITYGMHAQYLPARGVGIWQILGDVDSRRSGEAMALIRKILQELKDNPTGYTEHFARSRLARMRSVGRAKVTAHLAAARLTYIAQYGLEDDYHESYVRALAETTPADVASLIGSELAESRYVLGLVGPEQAIAQAKAAF